MPTVPPAIGWSVERIVSDWETSVKKGRHRRFEEARALKRGPDIDIELILNEPGSTDLDQDDEDDDYDPDSWTNPEVE